MSITRHEVGDSTALTIFRQVVFLNNQHDTSVEFFMSIHDTKKIPRISLSKYLRERESSEIQNNENSPRESTSVQAATSLSTALVPGARTAKV